MGYARYTKELKVLKNNENDRSHINLCNRVKSVKSVEKTTIEQLKCREGGEVKRVAKCKESVNEGQNDADDTSMRSERQGGAVVTHEAEEPLRSEKPMEKVISDNLSVKNYIKDTVKQKLKEETRENRMSEKVTCVSGLNEIYRSEKDRRERG